MDLNVFSHDLLSYPKQRMKRIQGIGSWSPTLATWLGRGMPNMLHDTFAFECA